MGGIEILRQMDCAEKAKLVIIGIVEELGSFEAVYAKMEVCDRFGVWFGGRKPDVKVGSLEVHSKFSEYYWSC